ncbi:Cathepsin L [Spironucleus salmonicida]|uniref:Cathepsin L n=1 Tax=Spironucleus salmonicida TaxID=348837 RepID=V6LUD1_9EUKA|nr:Cathepsin L [Spironucleus salmonicida]|eukprot:EST48175.1 Papain family cysteine protease [Spironucleus salmonicida]
MLLLLAFNCNAKFKAFKRQYSKSYETKELEDQAQKYFCANLQVIKAHPSRKLYISQFSDRLHAPATGYMAPNLPEELVSYTAAAVDPADAKLETYNRKSLEIVKAICSDSTASSIKYVALDDDFIKNNVFSGADLPQSVDLRKDGLTMRSIDQGTCGSCWAQATRFVMHSLFMHDITYYREIHAGTSLENQTNIDLVFSVEYIMNNSYGQNLFCAGGNYQYAAQDIADYKVSSLNYEEDAPYVSIFDSDSAPPIIKPDTAKQNPSAFNEKHWLNPVFWLNDDTGFNCAQSLIQIKLRKQGVDTTDATQIRYLKSFLARGIAVSGRQLVPFEGAEALSYSQYRGGILTNTTNPCPKSSYQQSNHQVTFIGYGTVKGTEVWVLMNSWGTQWGVGGSFYVEIGSNALCNEYDAVAVLPRFSKYNTTKEPLGMPYNQSELYKQGHNKYVYDLFPEVRWGMNGLDSVDTAGKPVFLSGNISHSVWILAGVASIFFMVIMSFICKCLCCPPPKKIKVALYEDLPGAQVQEINWSKGISG